MKNIYAKYKILLYIIFVACLLIIAIRCAKVGYISGGPKDVDPPKMLGSTPPINSINFKGKKISIDFDEYLQLKDVNQQLNISPPLKKKPTVWLKNKSVIVQFTDTLKDSTTYTFGFGNSIADNDEGNVLPNFEFAFSTGNYLDSLCIRGRIFNAFTSKPDKEQYLAMLYKNLSDSAPYKEVPMYTARTDDYGYYSINNVKPGIYRLYGLRDKNYNYKYDPKSESFAFIDTAVSLTPLTVKKLADKKAIFPPDTVSSWKDSTHKKVFIDSLKLRRNRNSLYFDLYSFREKDYRQFIRSYIRKYRRCINLGFNNPLKNDSIIFTPINVKANNWYQLEKIRKSRFFNCMDYRYRFN